MAVKKTATTKVAAKAVESKTAKSEEVKAAEKKPATRSACAKKCATTSAVYINAESVGFRAGDVYQALAAAGKTLTVPEIAKSAAITEKEVLLGLGWLFKEGKVKGENVDDVRLA